MIKSLLFYWMLGAVLIPANSDLISVCIEDDQDLRVDCLVEPKPSRINSYEFSWSSGNKEAVINTNVSGAASEALFRDKSYVEELDPHGYRLTLTGFTETLPHNTTYMCKISGNSATITIERDLLLTCSAVSVFLKTSCIWVMSLLIFLQQMHC
uniref:Ig-like domain-containing protein n=1 Tax=Neogobius melanostomus TaxID=47308 RepID=A0A8C6S3K9_9GOBI